jgi:hypothetical protein
MTGKRYVDRTSSAESRGAGGRRETLIIYMLAGVVYVVLGAFIPEMLFSWFQGVPFLIAFIWAARRVLGRNG